MTLVLDVVSNVDYSKIEAEVQKIRENLAKIPDKVTIDIQFDASGDATSSIKKMYKEVNTLASTSTNVGKSVSKALENAQKNAASAYASGWKALGGRVSSLESAPKEAIIQYNALADAMQTLDEKLSSGKANAAELSESADKVALAVKKMNAAFAEQDVFDKMISQEERSVNDLSKALENAQKNAASAYASGEKALDKYTGMYDTAPDSAKAKYDNLVVGLATLRNLRESGTGTADDLAAATNKVTLAIKELSAAFVVQEILEKNASAAANEAANSLKALENAQKNAASAYASGEKALSKYSGLKYLLPETDKDLYGNLDGAVSVLNDLRKSGVSDADALAKATDNVTIAIEKLSAAFAKQESSRRNSGDTIKKYTESVNILARAEQNLKKWSAMGGSSDDSTKSKYDTFSISVQGLNEAMAAFDGTSESANKLADASQKVALSMAEAGAAGRKAGLLASDIKTKISGLVSYYGAMLTGIQGFQLAIKATKKLASEAIAIDDSMTQLRIVTNESDEAFKQYGDDVAKTAQKIGSSITDVIDATTVFARLGYSLKDSSTLAELTAMLQRVGDIEAADAQASLTSIIKAFDIDVSDMESVMDKLVTVGNGFPISVSEIADGMMNASSALAAAGNSFDKSVALLAAANTTLQDANKASTGLRTITARIRKTDSELNDLGEAMTESAYEDLVGALTKYNVSLRDANGEYRDTYDIMKDIAAVWNEMTSSEQAALAELAAGNRQQTVFYSIIKNFDSVAAASMEAMGNAGGAMQDAYGEWMDSITAHIETFKAAFEGLANDLIQSDLLTGLIDIGTWFINIADTVVKLNDNLGTTALTIGSIVAVLNSIKSIS